MKIFVAGTDTGVGKTFVSIGLAKINSNSIVYKPVASGTVFFQGKRISQDALLIKKTISPKEDISTINPVLFIKPMAPFMELLIDGNENHLGKKKLQKRILNGFQKLLRKYENIIVEGIGGVLVPILRNYFCIDIAKDLRLPVIIVTRPTLGTINHTALTIEACRKRRIKIVGVIVNYHSNFKKGVVEKWNPRVISKCFGIKIIGTVPYLKDSNERYSNVFFNIAKKIRFELRDMQ